MPETQETPESVSERLYRALRQAAGAQVLLFDCADYDGDGTQEAFAFVGTEQEEALAGQVWFVSGESAEPLWPEGDGELVAKDDSRIVPLGDGRAVWHLEAADGPDSSLIWEVRSGVPAQSILSGKGKNFARCEDGSFVLYQTGTDAGTTEKPCRFYVKDGRFYEYGLALLGWETAKSLPGEAECVAPLEAEGYWLSESYLRGDGAVLLNLTDNTDNQTLTCVWQDGGLVTESQERGAAGRMIGEIGGADWFGPDGELEQLWQQEQKRRREDGLFEKLRADRDSWYDLDGDGSAERIGYAITWEAEGDFAEGMGLFVDQKTVWQTGEEAYGGYDVWVTDLDRGDGKKELAVRKKDLSDGVLGLTFFAWENGELREIGDLMKCPVLEGEGSFFRFFWNNENGQIVRAPGDGTLTVWADTPVYAPGFGCYFAKLTYALTGNGFVQERQEEYEITCAYNGQDPYRYTASRPIAFYADWENGEPVGEPVFTAEPGDPLLARALRTKAGEGKILVKMQSVSDGQEGWAVFGEEAAFAETPGWG